METKLKKCILVYMCILFIYVFVCFLSSFDSYFLNIEWPSININIINQYPDFEGAKLF
jgi:hypothetical protein